MALPPLRTVFVSGASAGIGAAVTRRALAAGCEVWGTARRRERLDAWAAEPRFHAVELDLEDGPGAVRAYQAAARAAGGFDVAVNNASYGVFAPYAEVDFDQWRLQLQAMLVHTAELVQAELVDMLRRPQGGVLVTTTSLAVEFPLPFMTGYNVAKAGLSALCDSLLIETRHTPVCVIDFRPGDVRTGFNDAMRRPQLDGLAPAEAAAMERAFAALEKNLQSAPSPDQVAAGLWRAVQRRHRGVLRSGSVFQTVLAPLFQRLVPLAWARAVRWRYFGLR